MHPLLHRLVRLRARVLVLSLILLGLGCLGLALSGCTVIRDATQVHCQASLQTAYNANASLPASPQQAAIAANLVAVGAAIGATVSTTGAAVTGAAATGATP